MKLCDTFQISLESLFKNPRYLDTAVNNEMRLLINLPGGGTINLPAKSAGIISNLLNEDWSNLSEDDTTKFIQKTNTYLNLADKLRKLAGMIQKK